MQVGHLALDGIVTSRRIWVCRCFRTNLWQSGVDDFRIGHTHKDVKATRSILLEVGRFRHFDKGVQEMGAIERVSLEPFLAASLSRGTGVYDDSKSAWHQILDHRLARQGRRRFAVRLGSRANNDHAHGRRRPVGVRDRAGIQAGDGVY